MEAMSSIVKAIIAYGRRDTEAAVANAEQALVRCVEIGDDWGADNAQAQLAKVARDAGDDHRAAIAHQQGLRLWQSIDERWASVASESAGIVDRVGAPVFPRWPGDEDSRSVTRALAGTARIAATHGQPELAASLVGTVDVLLEERGAFMFGYDRFDNHGLAAAAARATLGAARFAELRTVGRARSLRSAVELAMGLDVPPPTRAPATAADRHGLTAREVEVLGLLVEGCTDRQVAARLFISPHTAANHVASILSKLGVPSRSAAAAYAVRHALA